MKTTFRNKILTIFLSSLFIVFNVFGQLQVNTSMTPTQLVQNVLIGGGVTATNVTYTGGPTAIAAFTTGSNPTNLGLDNGIVLTTGNPTQIPQPASGFMSTDLGMPGDADLNNIATGTTHDACVLEFDFTPLSDTIRFRYVFGSEEYPDFVCSEFNDIFAFFISGPNPLGGNYVNKNIALIPGTTLPVSINAVNNGTVGTMGTAGGCTSLAYSSDFVDNQALNGTTIVFNGFTTVFTAWCVVTPCIQYHIKLAIADVSDGMLDSGVFLEANSFSTNAISITPTYSNTAFGNNAIEGCTDGIFAITTPTPVTSPLTINYTVGGTATNGTDYTYVPNSITIPAGQDSTAVVIDALLDNLVEGTETVTLTFTNVCTTQVYTLQIIDNTSLTIAVTGTTTICSNSSASLSVSSSGGITPYTYNWSNGAGTNSTVVVSPASTTTYIVTVSDNCGQTATGDVTVTVVNNLNVAVTPTNPYICPDESVSLTASGASDYTWTPAAGLSSTTGAIVTASPTTTTTYTINGITSGCAGSTTVTVNIANPISATASSTDENCGHSNGTVTANSIDNCLQGFIYSWNTIPPQSTQTATNLSAGAYTVTVSCGGCTATATTAIANIAGPSVSISNIVNSTCGLSNGSASATANGGTIPYSYHWNCSPPQNSQIMSNIPPGTYNVTVTDANGCIAMNMVVITGTPGLSTSTSSKNEICNQSNGTATINVLGGTGQYSYLWNTNPPQTTPTATGLNAGTYIVAVTDSICTTSVQVTVLNSPGPTADFSAHPNVLTIMDGPVSFIDNSSGTIINWQWNFGDGSPNGSGKEINHDFNNIGTYLVTLIITDNNGCIDTTMDTIKVKDIFTFYVPNAFSPDGDGFNDYFSPEGINWDTDHFEMYIFDRWGNLIYQTKTVGEKWNGTINNNGTQDDMLVGAYVYQIIVKELEGPRHQYIGKVTLVR